MDWALSREKPGWSWNVSGDCAMNKLEEMRAEAVRVLAEPADTKVVWSDAGWVHLAFLQILMALQKSLKASGFTMTLTTNAPGLDAVIDEFDMADATCSTSSDKSGKKAAASAK